MTPSTSSTFGGFLQGMQAQTMGIIGTVFGIFVLWLIVRWFANRLAENQEEAREVGGFANKGALALGVVAVLFFGYNALMFTTNVIPHSTLDRSSINLQMDSNIKK